MQVGNEHSLQSRSVICKNKLKQAKDDLAATLSVNFIVPKGYNLFPTIGIKIILPVFIILIKKTRTIILAKIYLVKS